jgi:hypoxanthine phosphoribosyltransferase
VSEQTILRLQTSFPAIMAKPVLDSIKTMSTKTYLTAQGLLEDSFKMGAEIIASGFRPTIIIALWRGGTPIGIAVQELLAYSGIETDHIAIRTSSYSGIDGRSAEIRIHGTNYLVKHARHEDRLLIVDDVFDTGLTIDAVIKHLQEKTRLNMPHEVRVAVPYFKPTRNKTARIPDYYLYETEEWLKYPHSLEGLGVDEVAASRPALYEIIKEHLPKS